MAKVLAPLILRRVGLMSGRGVSYAYPRAEEVAG